MGCVLEVMDGHDTWSPEHKTRGSLWRQPGRMGTDHVCVWGWYKKVFRKAVFVGLYFSLKVEQSLLKYLQAELRGLGTWASSVSTIKVYGKGGNGRVRERERDRCLGGEGESSGNCKIPPQLAVNLLFPGVPKSYILLGPHCHSSVGAAFPDTVDAVIQVGIKS